MRTELLKQAISICTSVGDKLPVLFYSDGKKLTLGTAGSQASVVVSGGTSFPEGKFVLPFLHAIQLSKALKNSSPVSITELNTTSVTFSQGNSKTTYTLDTTENFDTEMLLSYYSEDFVGEYPGDALKRAISRVQPFVGSASLLKLQGIHFTFGDVTQIMGTNNFCLARVKIDGFNVSSSETFIAPRQIFGISKAFGSSVKIAVKDKRVSFYSKDELEVKMVMVTIQDEPLPYQKLMDGFTPNTSIVLEPKELTEGLSSALYFTDSELHNKVKMEYNNKGLVFSSMDAHKGEAEVFVEVESINSEGELFVSADYLSRGASTLSGKVSLGINSQFLKLSDKETDIMIASIKR